MSMLDITPQAQQDIDDIYDYIARRDGRPSTADKIVAELTEACQSCAKVFADGSTFGTARSDLGEGYRVFAHKRWVIVFRPTADGIEVLRLFDGSRDYGPLFE